VPSHALDFLERNTFATAFSSRFSLPSSSATPPPAEDYIRLGDYRGVYTSAWIGVMVSMVTTCFVSLVGFYIVKNAIDRDRQTGVGQILATTPLSKSSYLLGKFLSNFAVLASMVYPRPSALLSCGFSPLRTRASTVGPSLSVFATCSSSGCSHRFACPAVRIASGSSWRRGQCDLGIAVGRLASVCQS